MKKKLLFIFLIYICTYFSVSAVELRHSIGGEIAFYGFSSFPNDPFSLPSGIGIFYTLNPVSKPAFFYGADILWFGFIPDSNFYLGSMMIIPSITFGYHHIFDFTHGSELNLSPYFSYGHYFRSVEIDDSNLWYNRPVISAGIDIDLYTEIQTVSSLGIFTSIIADDEPIIILGLKVKTGYSWKSVN